GAFDPSAFDRHAVLAHEGAHTRARRGATFCDFWNQGGAGARQLPPLAEAEMTALDIFVVLLLRGAALIRFGRGFTHEVLALLAWVAGIAALKLFHTPLQTRLVDTVGTEAGAS